MDLNANIFVNKYKLVLSYCGIWMLPHRNLPYKCYTASIGILHGGFLICNLIHMGVVWGDVDQMSEGSYTLFIHMTNCYKFSNFVLRKHTFEKLLRSMDAKVFKSKSAVHDAILTKHATRFNNLYNVWVVGLFLNCVLWGVIPQFNKTQKTLPFDIWMPGDTQTSPSYELGYCIQMLILFNGSQLSQALDVLFVVLVMFLCAQVEMIMVDYQKIKEIPLSGLSTNKKNELIKKNNQILIESIRQHQAAMRFHDDVANMFHISIFILMSGIIMIVCVIMLRISVDPPNTMHFYSTLIYLILVLTQLFLYCWCGHELTTRTEQLRDRLYLCPWYDCDIRFRRTLFIAMECMKRPMVFIAGHFITLSRATFVSILRCSYSYYTVLNQVQRTD